MVGTPMSRRALATTCGNAVPHFYTCSALVTMTYGWYVGLR